MTYQPFEHQHPFLTAAVDAAWAAEELARACRVKRPGSLCTCELAAYEERLGVLARWSGLVKAEVVPDPLLMTQPRPAPKRPRWAEEIDDDGVSFD